MQSACAFKHNHILSLILLIVDFILSTYKKGSCNIEISAFSTTFTLCLVDLPCIANLISLESILTLFCLDN